MSFNPGSFLGPLLGLWDIWTYWPQWVLKAWIAGGIIIAIVVIALAVPSLTYRFNPEGQTYRQAHLDREAHKAALRNLETEGFSTVGTLTPAAPTQTDPAAPAAPPPEEITVRAKAAQQQPDGTILQQAAIVYKQDVSRFTYALLPSRLAWQKGSALAFEGDAPEGLRLDEALRKDYVEKLVKESDKIVCIGVASAELAPTGENLALADDRAINLCRALHNIGYADETRQQTYGLSLGEAQGSVTDTLSASLQRSVIVVGVMNSRRVPHPEDIVRSLVQLIQVPGVKLDNYKRSDGLRYATFSNIGRGNYDGYAGTSWNTRETAADDNPFARDDNAAPPASKPDQ